MTMDVKLPINLLPEIWYECRTYQRMALLACFFIILSGAFVFGELPQKLLLIDVHWFTSCIVIVNLDKQKKAYGFLSSIRLSVQYSVFESSSLVRIGFLPFGIYKTFVEKLSLKMPKNLENSRLFGGASFLFPFYGAGGGTRTHTMLPPTDFESVTSTNSITPAYCFYYSTHFYKFQ